MPGVNDVIRNRRLNTPSVMSLLGDALEYLEATGHGDHDIAWMIRDVKKRGDSALVDELLKRVDKRLNPEPRAPTATVDVKIQNLLFDLGKLTRIRGV